MGWKIINNSCYRFSVYSYHNPLFESSAINGTEKRTVMPDTEPDKLSVFGKNEQWEFGPKKTVNTLNIFEENQ